MSGSVTLTGVAGVGGAHDTTAHVTVRTFPLGVAGVGTAGVVTTQNDDLTVVGGAAGVGAAGNAVPTPTGIVGGVAGIGAVSPVQFSTVFGVYGFGVVGSLAGILALQGVFGTGSVEPFISNHTKVAPVTTGVAAIGYGGAVGLPSGTVPLGVYGTGFTGPPGIPGGGFQISGGVGIGGVHFNTPAGSNVSATAGRPLTGLWVVHGTLPIPLSIYQNPMVDGVVVGLGWNQVAAISNDPTGYDWSLLANEISQAQTYGKQIGVEIDAGATCPTWLFTTEGCSYLSVLWVWAFTYSACSAQQIACCWDPIFVQYWTQFIGQFATWLNTTYPTNNPVTYLHATGVQSQTGELLLSYNVATGVTAPISCGVNPTLPTAQYQAAGYTPNAIISAFQAIANAWQSNFPNTKKVFLFNNWGLPPIDNTGTITGQAADYTTFHTLVSYWTSLGSNCIIGSASLTANYWPPYPSYLPPGIPEVAQPAGSYQDVTGCRNNSGVTPCNSLTMVQQSVATANARNACIIEFFQSDWTNLPQVLPALAQFVPNQPPAPLPQNTGTGYANSPIAGVNIIIPGVAGTGVANSAAAIFKISAALTGVYATGLVNVTVVSGYPSGASGIGAAGGFSETVTKSLTGAHGIATIGVVSTPSSPAIEITNASGIAGIGVAGDVVATGALTGAAGLGFAGILTIGYGALPFGVAGIGVANAAVGGQTVPAPSGAIGVGWAGALLSSNQFVGVHGLAVTHGLVPTPTGIPDASTSSAGIGFAGNFVFSQVVAAPSATGVGVAGGLVAAPTATPLGVAGIGAAGGVKQIIAPGLTGAAGVGSVGVTATTGVVAGASGLGSAGSLTPGVVPLALHGGATGRAGALIPQSSQTVAVAGVAGIGSASLTGGTVVQAVVGVTGIGFANVVALVRGVALLGGAGIGFAGFAVPTNLRAIAGVHAIGIASQPFIWPVITGVAGRGSAGPLAPTAIGSASLALLVSGSAFTIANAVGAVTFGLTLGGTALATTTAAGAITVVSFTAPSTATTISVGQLTLPFTVAGSAAITMAAVGNYQIDFRPSAAGGPFDQASGGVTVAFLIAGSAVSQGAALSNWFVPTFGLQVDGSAVATNAAVGGMTLEFGVLAVSTGPLTSDRVFDLSADSRLWALSKDARTYVLEPV